MNFGSALTLFRSFAALKAIAYAMAGTALVWLYHDFTSAKATAAVMTERNRYLISLHSDRDAADARINAARDALSERNAGLAQTIEEIRAGQRAAPVAVNPAAGQCPAHCLLLPTRVDQ